MPTDTANTGAGPEIVTAAFIIIGDEILSGRTKDANLGFIADELVEAGIRLKEVRVISDDEDEIVDTVRALSAKYDYVFTSGGIGPTHDDITCDSVAKAFDRGVSHHPEAVKRMRAHAGDVGVDLNEARMRMARTPDGAELILNPVSAAPGFIVENVHVMAGVPRIFQAMVKELLPTLKGGDKIHSIAVSSNLGEGRVATGLGEIQARYPAIAIGSYPYFRAGNYGTTLVLRGTEMAVLEAAAEEVRQLIRDQGGDASDVEDN
ncbi:MAG: competence/damage-inducible protein A [Alphaproteobacteria bacterium]|jgi:molybdenum cofactor synthesis domain-containing protein|nr:competence/damage-inducible protein A [Alphaproteobacteria bacterium]